MQIRPLHDWVVIDPRDAEETTAGGIVIPDTAQEKPQEGTVIRVGKGRYEDEKDDKGNKRKDRKFIQNTLKPGDRILYEKYLEKKVDLDGKEVIMVREENVLGLYG